MGPISRNRVVQGLWVGKRLSAMQRMSIASFLAHGHAFHLYAYEAVEGVPPGVTLMDANAVLSSSSIFQYADYASYAGFANFFRYKLLWERGGWWVDLDLVCLKPFDFTAEYAFSSQRTYGVPGPNCGAMKVPPGSAVMKYAWDRCQQKDPGQLQWGETGPVLIAEAIAACGLESFVHPPDMFCAIDFPDWRQVLDPAPASSSAGDAYGLHLWNEMWRRANEDPDQRRDPACLYEQLRRRYLGQD